MVWIRPRSFAVCPSTLSPSGTFRWMAWSRPIFRDLPTAQPEELRRAGLLVEGRFSSWTVFKTYYWQQRFTAHRILHSRHEYEPERGLQYLDLDGLENGSVASEG